MYRNLDTIEIGRRATEAPLEYPNKYSTTKFVLGTTELF
jgi:hypothetical protein